MDKAFAVDLNEDYAGYSSPDEAYQAGLADAEPPENIILAEDKKEKSKKSKKEATLDAALRILKDHCVATDKNGNMYKYEQYRWAPTKENVIYRVALDYDNQSYTTHSRRVNIYHDIRALTQRLEDMKFNQIGEHEIPLADCVYDVKTGKRRPHRPEDYLDALVPHKMPRRDAKCPMWLKKLHDYWGQDAEYQRKVNALQEYLGYILMVRKLLKKCLVLLGPSNSSKSGITHLIELLVGEENTCQVRLQDMGDPKLMAPIVGKIVNILPEVDQDVVISEAGFKTLVSNGDSIQVNGKFKDAYSYKSYAKHVIATNALPNVKDITDATYNRWLLLNFTKIYNPGAPGTIPYAQFINELNDELEGILNWAIEGAERLIQNKGVFTAIQDSDDIIKEERLDDPVTEYMNRYYVIKPCVDKKHAAACYLRIPVDVMVDHYTKTTRSKNMPDNFVAKFRKRLKKSKVFIEWSHGIAYAHGLERRELAAGFEIPPPASPRENISIDDN